MERKETLPRCEGESSTEELPDRSPPATSSLPLAQPGDPSHKPHSPSRLEVRRAKLSLRKKGKENQCSESAPTGGTVTDLNENDDVQSLDEHKDELVQQWLSSLEPCAVQTNSAHLSVGEGRLPVEQRLEWQCPACGERLADPGADHTAHLTFCLHKQFARTPVATSSGDDMAARTDEEVARELAQREQEKVEEERRTEEDCYFCQLCNKDLSRMNSACRAQHVNRCMDEDLEKRRLLAEAERELERARTAVLDCPLCGKHLNSEAARRSHLKRCAQDLQVSTEQLLALVAAQEEERKAQVAAGILPSSVSARPRMTRSASNQSDNTKPPAKKRKGQEDENTQLAMALSSSLATLQEQQQQQLQPGAPTSSNQGREGRRAKRQRAEEASSLLLQLDRDASQRRIAERVSLMLENQAEVAGTAATAEEGLQTSRLAGSGDCYSVLTASPHLASGGGLWDRTALTRVGEAGPGTEDARQEFYVPALMPPVRAYLAGVKLRSSSRHSSWSPHRQPQDVEFDADERRTCLPPWQRDTLPSPSSQRHALRQGSRCHSSRADSHGASLVNRADSAPHIPALLDDQGQSVSAGDSDVGHHELPATAVNEMEMVVVEEAGPVEPQTEGDKQWEVLTEQGCGESGGGEDSPMSTQAVLVELAAEGECATSTPMEDCIDLTDCPPSPACNQADCAQDVAEKSTLKGEDERSVYGTAGETEQCSSPIVLDSIDGDESKCVSKGDKAMGTSERAEKVLFVDGMVTSPGVSEMGRERQEEDGNGKTQNECTCCCKSCTHSQELTSAPKAIQAERVHVDRMSQMEVAAVKHSHSSSGLATTKGTVECRGVQTEGESGVGGYGPQAWRRLCDWQDQAKGRRDRKTQTEARSCKNAAVMTMPTLSHSSFFFQSPAHDLELGGQGLAGLQEVLVGLVGSSLYADVQLVDRDNKHIPAHKVLIAARCPQMLALIRPSANGEVIQLDGAEEAEVRALLRYMYASVVHPLHCKGDRLVELADRLKFVELAAAVKAVNSPSSNPHPGHTLSPTLAHMEGSPPSQAPHQTWEEGEGNEGGADDGAHAAAETELPGWREVCRSQPKPLSCTEAYDFLAGSSSSITPPAVLSCPSTPCMSPPVAPPVSPSSGDLAQLSLPLDTSTRGSQEAQAGLDKGPDERELSSGQEEDGRSAGRPDSQADMAVREDALLCDPCQMSGEDLFSEEDDDVVFMGSATNPVMTSEDAVVGEVEVDGSFGASEVGSMSYSQEFNDSLSAVLMACPMEGLEERNSRDIRPEEELEPQGCTNNVNHGPNPAPGRAGTSLMDRSPRKSKDCLANRTASHPKNAESSGVRTSGPSSHQEFNEEAASCRPDGSKLQQAGSRDNCRQPVTSTPVKGGELSQPRSWAPESETEKTGDPDASPPCSPVSSPVSPATASASDPDMIHYTRSGERKTYGRRQANPATKQLSSPVVPSCSSQAYSVLTNISCSSSQLRLTVPPRGAEVQCPGAVQAVPSPEPPFGHSPSPSPQSECELSTLSSASQGKGLLSSASPAHEFVNSGNDDDDDDEDCIFPLAQSAAKMSQFSSTKRGLARRNVPQDVDKYLENMSSEKRETSEEGKTSKLYGVTKQRGPDLKTATGEEKAVSSLEEDASCFMVEDGDVSASGQAHPATKHKEYHLKNGFRKHGPRSFVRGRRLAGDQARPRVKHLQASDSRCSRLFTKEVVRQSAKGIKIYPPISKTVSYCGRKRKRMGSDCFSSSQDEYASSDDSCRMLLCQVHLTDLKLPVGAEFQVTAPESRCKRPRRSRSAEGLRCSMDSMAEVGPNGEAEGSSDKSKLGPGGKGRSAYWLVTMTRNAARGVGKPPASRPCSLGLSDTDEDLPMTPADSFKGSTASSSVHAGTDSASFEKSPVLPRAARSVRGKHRRKPMYRVRLPPPRQRASRERRLQNSSGSAQRNRTPESRNIFNTLTSMGNSSSSGEGRQSTPSPRKPTPWKPGQGRFEWGMMYYEESLPVLNSPVRRQAFKSSPCSSPEKSQFNSSLEASAPPPLSRSLSPCAISVHSDSASSEPPVLSPIAPHDRSPKSEDCSPRKCPKLSSEFSPPRRPFDPQEDAACHAGLGDSEAAVPDSCVEGGLAQVDAMSRGQETSPDSHPDCPAERHRIAGASRLTRRSTSLLRMGQHKVLLPKHCFGGEGETCREPRGTTASNSLETPASDQQDGRGESEEREEESKDEEDAAISGGAGSVWEGFDDPGAGEDVQIVGMSFSRCVSTQAALDEDSDDSLPDISPLLYGSSVPPPSLLPSTPPSPPSSVSAPCPPPSAHTPGSRPPVRHSSRASRPAQVFKTPTPSKRGRKRKLQHPSPFTPMPDYGTMATPELKKRAEDYGMRALGRKKVIIVLEDIHRQMHQYETDSAADDSVDMDSSQRSVEDDSSSDNDDIIPSQESEKSDVQEESFLGAEDVPATQEMNGDGLHKQLSNFFQDNPDVHRDSVMYEAHDLETLMQRIKAAGIHCSTERVIQFLDLRGITYTMKNMRKKAGHRRQRRRPSPKKKVQQKAQQNSVQV